MMLNGRKSLLTNVGRKGAVVCIILVRVCVRICVIRLRNLWSLGMCFDDLLVQMFENTRKR